MWNNLTSAVQAMGNVFLTPDLVELNQNIEDARRAVAVIPDGPAQLDLLGNLLGVRYSRLGREADLDASIQFARRAIHVTPASDPSRNRYRSNLAVGLGGRYASTGNLADLDEAIQAAQEVVDSTLQNDTDWSNYANNLAAHLKSRYSQTGSTADLDKAIRLWRKAIEVAAANHTPQAITANNLAIALRTKYSLSGNEGELDEAIQVTRRVLDATKADDPDRARRLNNLANCLGDRYAKKGTTIDLEEAIESAHEATALIPEDHLDRNTYLNNLGVLLGDMYTRTGSLDALNEAIEIGRKTIVATPKGHPNRPGRLNNLGIQLRYRHAQTQKVKDLDECIRLLREALTVIDPSHPDWAQWSDNLKVLLGDKYQQKNELQTPPEAVETTQPTVVALSHNTSDKAAYLNIVADRLADHSLQMETTNDPPATILSYQSALHQSEPQSSPSSDQSLTKIDLTQAVPPPPHSKSDGSVTLVDTSLLSLNHQSLSAEATLVDFAASLTRPKAYTIPNYQTPGSTQKYNQGDAESIASRDDVSKAESSYSMLANQETAADVIAKALLHDSESVSIYNMALARIGRERLLRNNRRLLQGLSKDLNKSQLLPSELMATRFLGRQRGSQLVSAAICYELSTSEINLQSRLETTKDEKIMLDRFLSDIDFATEHVADDGMAVPEQSFTFDDDGDTRSDDDNYDVADQLRKLEATVGFIKSGKPFQDYKQNLHQWLDPSSPYKAARYYATGIRHTQLMNGKIESSSSETSWILNNNALRHLAFTLSIPLLVHKITQLISLSTAHPAVLEGRIRVHWTMVRCI